MIRNILDNKIAEALKNKENSKLKVLRLIKSEFQKFETSGKDISMSDAMEVKILKKMQKQWKEEIEAFTNAGRDTSSLTLELEYLETFIPKEITEEEQKTIARKVIETYLLGLPIEDRKGMKHLGAIMKIINKEYPTINGKIVSEIYKNIIN